MVALVIDDLGLNRTGTRRTLALRAPLTLALMTYAPGLERLAERARAAGHELLLHVPMEPSNGAADPGPKVLTTRLSQAELRDRLIWGLDRFAGYVGINNHMGSRFTRDRAGMSTVLAEVKARGLLFFDSRTSGATIGERLAHEMGVPTVRRDVFLDDELGAEEVWARLRQLERRARRNGHAVAIGHPRRVTLDAIEAWLATLDEKGLALVPLTTIVRLNGSAGGSQPCGQAVVAGYAPTQNGPLPRPPAPEPAPC